MHSTATSSLQSYLHNSSSAIHTYSLSLSCLSHISISTHYVPPTSFPSKHLNSSSLLSAFNPLYSCSIPLIISLSTSPSTLLLLSIPSTILTSSCLPPSILLSSWVISIILSSSIQFTIISLSIHLLPSTFQISISWFCRHYLQVVSNSNWCSLWTMWFQ
jgi:hypothetical protein